MKLPAAFLLLNTLEFSIATTEEQRELIILNKLHEFANLPRFPWLPESWEGRGIQGNLALTIELKPEHGVFKSWAAFENMPGQAVQFVKWCESTFSDDNVHMDDVHHYLHGNAPKNEQTGVRSVAGPDPTPWVPKTQVHWSNVHFSDHVSISKETIDLPRCYSDTNDSDMETIVKKVGEALYHKMPISYGDNGELETFKARSIMHCLLGAIASKFGC